MHLRSHPPSPRLSFEQLEARVCLSPTVPTVNQLLSASAMDLHDLFAIRAERMSEESCEDNDSPKNISATMRRREHDHCPPFDVFIDNDSIARFPKNTVTHAAQRKGVPDAEAIDDYFEQRDARASVMTEEMRVPSSFPAAPLSPSYVHHALPSAPSVLHDAVLDDVLAEGSVLSAVLADRYLDIEKKTSEEDMNFLKERQRWEEVVPQRNVRRQMENTIEKSEPPSYESIPDAEGEHHLKEEEHKNDEHDGESSIDTEPSEETGTSSSSIFSRSLKGARALTSRAWSGFRRLLAA